MIVILGYQSNKNFTRFLGHADEGLSISWGELSVAILAVLAVQGKVSKLAFWILLGNFILHSHVKV